MKKISCIYESTKFLDNKTWERREDRHVRSVWIEFTSPGAWRAADGPDTRSDIPVSYFSRVFLPAILWLIVFEYSKGHAPLPVAQLVRVRGCSVLLLFSFSFPSSPLLSLLFFFLFLSFKRDKPLPNPPRSSTAEDFQFGPCFTRPVFLNRSKNE